MIDVNRLINVGSIFNLFKQHRRFIRIGFDFNNRFYDIGLRAFPIQLVGVNSLYG